MQHRLSYCWSLCMRKLVLAFFSSLQLVCFACYKLLEIKQLQGLVTSIYCTVCLRVCLRYYSRVCLRYYSKSRFGILNDFRTYDKINYWDARASVCSVSGGLMLTYIFFTACELGAYPPHVCWYV
jgi:hypothetical protein